jgi:hypothetical protein
MSLIKKWGSAEISFWLEMMHSFPAALTDPKYADVKFLGLPHRHMILIKVAIQVFHEDRDIEFIQFKRWCQSLYGDKVIEADNQSCEMISDILAEKIHEKYPGREMKICVFEDGENGSVAHYKPDFLN